MRDSINWSHLLRDVETAVVWKVAGDGDTQAIQARISLDSLGNAARQARKGQPRTAFGHFGDESTLSAIESSEAVRAQSAKRKELTLANALGLGRLPRPR